jgi:MYXO-CTERM domain-containing protein
MVARTSNSRADVVRRGRNPRAAASLGTGLAAVAAVPAGIAASWYFEEVTLLQSTGAGGLAALLGLCAILLARRGRETVALTLGRSGGEGLARAGKALGVLGLCVAATTALAVAFYGLLTLLAD